jgi:hypothetical protein
MDPSPAYKFAPLLKLAALSAWNARSEIALRLSARAAAVTASPLYL